MDTNTGPIPDEPFLRPIDIKRQARVPYRTVIGWIEVGHPRAGYLPSVNLAPTGKRRSYRVRAADWAAFLLRLETEPQVRQQAEPAPRPRTARATAGRSVFRY